MKFEISCVWLEQKVLYEFIGQSKIDMRQALNTPETDVVVEPFVMSHNIIQNTKTLWCSAALRETVLLAH